MIIMVLELPLITKIKVRIITGQIDSTDYYRTIRHSLKIQFAFILIKIFEILFRKKI